MPAEMPIMSNDVPYHGDSGSADSLSKCASTWFNSRTLSAENGSYWQIRSSRVTSPT